MDDPALATREHLAALRGLERINRWSRSAGILGPPLWALAAALTPREVRVLDVATGAGDLPIRLARAARRRGVRLSLDACDVSDRALGHARARAAAAGADVRFFRLDAVRAPIPAGYDAIVSSMFLHHLAEPDAAAFLRGAAAAAGRLVLINDLRRGPVGLALAYAGTRLLSRSAVVHADGPQSVRAAFTLDEVRGLAERAGLAGARVEPRWPCRFLLAWSRG